MAVALALRFAARRVPRVAVEEAWPAERRLLDRLIGVEPTAGGRSARDEPDFAP